MPKILPTMRIRLHGDADWSTNNNKAQVPFTEHPISIIDYEIISDLHNALCVGSNDIDAILIQYFNIYINNSMLVYF